MAMKVFTLDRLTQYDGLIKNYIDTADAKSLKTVAISGNTLKFYKIEEPVGETTPAYEITLPSTDISGLLAKLEGATVGNVVTVAADGEITDGGVALTDLATKAEVEAVNGKADANATAIEAKIGTLADLDTTAKTDLVNAINEVRAAVDVGGTGSQVTIDTSATTEGYLKSYTIKQGDNTVGVIDIPKDLVVTAGEIVVDPDGQPVGTYLKLTIANQTSPVYINVADLVDAYTAQANGTQIQLAISDTNEISATIVAKSIGTNELADASINTAKIADANVTAAKLADDAKALFDTKGSADTALEDAKTYTDEQLANIEAISEDEINAMFATS